MTRFLRHLLFPAVLTFALAARAAGPFGADNGWAIDDSGNPLLTGTVASRMSQGETGWIRVEMRLIPGHTNWDSTMLGYYDTAVNNARNAGLQVPLLIDGGSLPGGQTAWTQNNHENNSGTNGDNPFVDAFASNAVATVVQHFHDRVKFYEIWNEPNAWTASPSNGVFTGGSFLYPSNFGWLLARSWEAVHKTLGITDVTLVFGGVFGHNIGGVQSYANAGAQYIDDTYSNGTNTTKGGSFAYIKTKYNAYPLDGIGEHIYIYQGSTLPAGMFRQYEDWVHQACTKYEGAGTAKKTFISEFGWQTQSGVTQAIQDDNLAAAFNAIQGTPYVQMAIWFQWADNAAGGLYYGVLDTTGSPKPSYPDYQRFERFEGMLANGSTNASILAYYNSLGHATAGNPFDNGHSAWVYATGSGNAQDYAGGSHSNLTMLNSTGGTFEVNNLHGMWNVYVASNGVTDFGFPKGNEIVVGGGTRQDFTFGYLSWDALNQVVWHAGPPAPTGLQVSPGNAQVALTWTTTPSATGYNVKRGPASNGAFTTISANVPTNNYTDSTVVNGTVYYYVVSATNSSGESANSGSVRAFPVAPPSFNSQPQSQTANPGATVQFNADVFSSVPASFQWQFQGADIAGATMTAYTLTNAQPTNSGNYTLTAANYGGTSVSSNATLLVGPTIGSSFDGVNFVLNWSGVYRLLAATNLGGPYVEIPGATSPYTNTNALPRQFFRLGQ